MLANITRSVWICLWTLFCIVWYISWSCSLIPISLNLKCANACGITIGHICSSTCFTWTITWVFTPLLYILLSLGFLSHLTGCSFHPKVFTNTILMPLWTPEAWYCGTHKIRNTLLASTTNDECVTYIATQQLLHFQTPTSSGTASFSQSGIWCMSWPASSLYGPPLPPSPAVSLPPVPPAHVFPPTWGVLSGSTYHTWQHVVNFLCELVSRTYMYRGIATTFETCYIFACANTQLVHVCSCTHCRLAVT